MLNRRQLRIKALESVYAYDKSLDKNIDFQISYFLKSNKNFFKLYVTCFSLLKELHLFANELHLKNQKKYINKDSDLPESWLHYFEAIDEDLSTIAKEINGPSWGVKQKIDIKQIFTTNGANY